MKTKALYSLSLMVTTVFLLVICIPVHASTMDDRIELAAKQSYVFKTYLQGDDIKIQSKEGVVSLKGTVSDNSHKALAQETVAGLPGVKGVENRLEIKGAPPSANSDAWLRDKVRATLLFHRSVNAGTTNVDVKDGIVTLRGDAANQAQKDLMTEYVKEVDGVKSVINEMSFTKELETTRTIGEKIDDASITAQVKLTLLYHRTTSAINTKVETKYGVVTLYGKAGSAVEMNLATKLANDVEGVKEVNNRMTIE